MAIEIIDNFKMDLLKILLKKIKCSKPDELFKN